MSNNFPHRFNRRNRAISDLIIISLVAAFILGLAIVFDLAEPTIDWFLSQRAWRFDEILIVLMILPFAFGLYSLRRWRDLENLFEEVNTGRERLKILSQRLVEAQEKERRYLARELHDEVGQALTAVKINLQASQRLSTLQPATPHLEESIILIEQLLQQVRNISLDLRPSILDDLGLVAALRWYLDRLGRRTGLVTQFVSELPEEVRFPVELENTCFRVVQEALTNTVKHGQANLVKLELRLENNELLLTISDDGVGFETQMALRRASQGASFGLLSLQERTAMVDGRLVITSGWMKGTTIAARFPVKRPPIQISFDSIVGEKEAV
jgi:signal transduction histidine kinase